MVSTGDGRGIEELHILGQGTAIWIEGKLDRPPHVRHMLCSTDENGTTTIFFLANVPIDGICCSGGVGDRKTEFDTSRKESTSNRQRGELDDGVLVEHLAPGDFVIYRVHPPAKVRENRDAQVLVFKD